MKFKILVLCAISFLFLVISPLFSFIAIGQTIKDEISSLEPLSNLREYLKKYGFYELGKIRASYRLDCCDCLGPARIYEVEIEGEKAKVSVKSCPQYPHLKFPEEKIRVKLDRDLLEELVRLHADLDFFNLDIEEEAGLIALDAGKHTMSYQFQGKAKRIDYVITKNETLKKIEALYEKIVNLAEVRKIEQALERERNREERERQKVIRNFISSDKAMDIVRNLPEVTALFQKRIPGYGAGAGVWQHPTPDEPVYIIRVTEHFDVSGRLQENIIGYYTVDAITGKIIKIERERR